MATVVVMAVIMEAMGAIMVDKIGPDDLDVVIKFGGGLHTRASEDEIDQREAAAGNNFLLDLENLQLRNRPPFDLIGQVPNGQEIRGGGSLLKSDGTVSTLVQAGDTVFEWDGITTFTSVGTVDPNARLRGHWRTHNFTLDDKLLLTDLNLVEVVKEWDGTTFADIVFTDEEEVPFGTFFAKYLSISLERAVFSHVRDPSQVIRHMMVGSKQTDFTQITVSNLPSNALSEEDPFFLLMPDLRPINGHVEAFGTTILSTQKGRLFNLAGSSAKDFSFSDFYPGSNASGEESLVYIGNDIIYGRQGRIESVTDTQRFGDSEADDLSRQISDQIEGFTAWSSAYNSRLNRAYLFPEDEAEVWIFNTALRGQQLSPWMRWKTEHPLDFKPTFQMTMLDPQNGLEFHFMGDEDGNFYRTEGTGVGDGGTTNIETEWLTKLFSAPLDSEAFNFEGWIKYRKGDSATVVLTFEFAGISVFNEAITITFPAVPGRTVYSGGAHYNDGQFYGTQFSGRLTRQKFLVAGQGNEFQLRVQVTNTANFEINEIGVRLTAASG